MLFRSLLFPQQGLWPLVPCSHAHLTSHWGVARVCPPLPLKVSSRQALAMGPAHRSLGLAGLTRVPVSVEHLPATAALPRRGLAAHTLALPLATVMPWLAGGEPCLTGSQQPCAILPDQGVVARPGPRKKEPRAGSPAPLQRTPTSLGPSRCLPPPSSRPTGSTSLLASGQPPRFSRTSSGGRDRRANCCQHALPTEALSRQSGPSSLPSPLSISSQPGRAQRNHVS